MIFEHLQNVQERVLTIKGGSKEKARRPQLHSKVLLPLWPLNTVLQFLVLMLNLDVMSNFITVPLRHCVIPCFNILMHAVSI